MRGQATGSLEVPLRPAESRRIKALVVPSSAVKGLGLSGFDPLSSRRMHKITTHVKSNFERWVEGLATGDDIEITRAIFCFRQLLTRNSKQMALNMVGEVLQAIRDGKEQARSRAAERILANLKETGASPKKQVRTRKRHR